MNMLKASTWTALITSSLQGCWTAISPFLYRFADTADTMDDRARMWGLINIAHVVVGVVFALGLVIFFATLLRSYRKRSANAS